MAEILKMNQDIQEYFRKRGEGQEGKARGNFNRAGLALSRAGYKTVQAMMDLDPEQIVRIRTVGAVSQKVINDERDAIRKTAVN